MNLAELYHEVHENLPRKWTSEPQQITPMLIRDIVDEVFRVIIEATLYGERVRIDGFGVFEPKERGGKALRYWTDEKDWVKSRQHIRIYFHSSRVWREALRRVFEFGKRP